VAIWATVPVIQILFDRQAKMNEEFAFRSTLIANGLEDVPLTEEEELLVSQAVEASLSALMDRIAKHKELHSN